MDKNLQQTYYLLLSCLLFLTFLSFGSSDITVLGLNLKQIDLFSEIRAEDIPEKTVEPEKTTVKKSENQKLITTPVPANKENLADIGNSVFITDNDTSYGFQVFLKKLNLLKNHVGKKIRIAHFGDSSIESDLVSADLRSLFQKEFGGTGIGFIPMVSVGPGTRLNTKHQFSSNWQQLNVKENSTSNYCIGISGYSSIAGAGSQVYSELSNNGKSNNFNCTKLRLFYGTTSGTSTLTLNDSNRSVLEGKEKINVLEKSFVKTEKIKIMAQCSAPQVFYGFSTECDSGIVLDNYSFRGSAGTTFVNYPENELKTWDSLLNYDLIVLQYGINAAQDKSNNYEWYEKLFNKNLSYLKKCFPHTAFLVIGCSDRAIKHNGVYKSLAGIPALIDVQKKCAQNNRCSFLDFYALMGGNGSIIKWVNEAKPLANKDYTHFTHKGAEKAAQLIYNSIYEQYKNYSHEVFFN